MSNLIQLPTKDSQIEKLQKDQEYHARQIAHHMRMSQRICIKLGELLGLEAE